MLFVVYFETYLAQLVDSYVRHINKPMVVASRCGDMIASCYGLSCVVLFIIHVGSLVFFILSDKFCNMEQWCTMMVQSDGAI